MIRPPSSGAVQIAVDSGAAAKRVDRLAPRPADLSETGLLDTVVYDLLVKHMYRGGILDLNQLSSRLALAGPVLEPMIRFLRDEAYVEVLSGTQGGSIRYKLTDKGQRAADEAMAKSGYIGPAPVTMETYTQVVRQQSVRTVKVERKDADRAFDDVVAAPPLVDRLGAAVNSGRPLFLYGPPGAGKTFLGMRLVRMVETDEILVPHSIIVGDTVIRVFDPSIHHRVDSAQTSALMLEEGHDPRFVRCRRPGVVTGGELTLDMLEVEYDAATRQYHAPQSLMANNGVYMIDDLGRQRMAPDAILNRWILPMEEGRDFLAVGAGQRFEVPFDLILIFSTNLDPLELADEAFLRRLGHKIRFRYATGAEYEEIWKRTCANLGLEFDPELLSQALAMYEAEDRPLLPCHPRDLLTSVVDRLEYEGRTRQSKITAEQLQQAWNSYFVALEVQQPHSPEVRP